MPNDFQLQSRYNRGVDWVIDYKELEPWYCQAEVELGVAGDNKNDFGSPRSKPYPKRPIAQTYLDKTISSALKGSEFQGIPLEVQPTPQAREPDRCLGSASCIPICPTGAKYEAIFHINKAIEYGAVIREKSIVSKLEVDSSGKIKAIQYLSWDGAKHQVKGRIYVLAAHGIETPKLLLMSKSATVPNGVANSSDQVGRNLMDHPLQLSWALAKAPVYPYRGPGSTSGIETLRDGDFRTNRGAVRIQISNDGWSWPTGAPFSTVKMLTDQNLFGMALRQQLKEQVHRHLQMAGMVEQLPDPNNRVLVSKEHVDAMGLPRPEIHFKVGDYEQKGLETVRKVIQSIFEKVGVTHISHHSEVFGSGHIMGTYRMGSNPKDSVVDRYQRTHDHDNLFLLGSGVFPTGGTANPTLTIAALALRTANYISEELKKLWR
jgi:choline dehydrogenase-like flavoprotein